VSTPLPPDDAETRVVEVPPVAPPPAAPPPVAPEDYEPEPSRGLGWGMLLAILVLIALAAAGAAIYFATRDNGNSNATTTTAPATTTVTTPAAPPPAKVFVPDVTGLKQDAAVQKLGQAHLVPVITFTPTKKPTGLVVSQTPKAATRTKPGTNVMLVVDKGSPNVAVPDVTGLKVADATSKLQAAGFKTQTTQVTVADKAPGTVVSQAPAAGDKVAKGSSITLSIAKGGATPTTAPAATTTTAGTAPQATTPAPTTTTAQPTSATVPDLSATDVQAAAQTLAKANLLASIQYVPGTDPLGTVVAQSPQAGGTAKPLSHVTVNASSGPNAKEQATVPNTVGQTLQQAVQTLNAAGLRLIFVKVPTSTPSSIGKVVEQTPLAGKTAPKNAQVLVYLGVKR
jgi:beta-lactam-binding protein with PASTA domain